MTPLAHFFPYGLAFWAVFLWAFVPESVIVSRGGGAERSAASPDAGSTRVIVLGMWIALALAVPLAYVPAWRFPPRAQVAAFWAGLVILIAGSLLRRHCWRMLGAASLAVYGYRMRVEERALLAAIGEPYAAFMRTRKRLVPFVF